MCSGRIRNTKIEHWLPCMSRTCKAVVADAGLVAVWAGHELRVRVALKHANAIGNAEAVGARARSAVEHEARLAIAAVVGGDLRPLAPAGIEERPRGAVRATGVVDTLVH